MAVAGAVTGVWAWKSEYRTAVADRRYRPSGRSPCPLRHGLAGKLDSGRFALFCKITPRGDGRLVQPMV